MAVLTLSICLLLIPALVRGQGFGIYEQGACTQSLGGAGVAEPCEDGSAIYVNPASGQTSPAIPSVELEPADGDARLFPTRTGFGPPATQQFSMTGLRAGEYVIRPSVYPGTTVVRIVANGQDVTTRTIDTSAAPTAAPVSRRVTRTSVF